MHPRTLLKQIMDANPKASEAELLAAFKEAILEDRDAAKAVVKEWFDDQGDYC